MLRRHLDGLLNFVLFPIIKAVAEGLNSKIQSPTAMSSTTASKSSSSAEDLTSSPLCNPRTCTKNRKVRFQNVAQPLEPAVEASKVASITNLWT
jgi:hypothetical protein